MNIAEANELNEELKNIMRNNAVKFGLDAESGERLIDKYVEIYPDELPIMGMVDLKEKSSSSIKPGNVLINQKAMLMEAIKLVVPLGIPDGKQQAVALGILGVLACVELSRITLDETESYIVTYLHTHQMYGTGEEEALFYHNFSEWYKEQMDEEISQKRIEKSLEHLGELKTINIINGNVVLAERVWHNRITG